MYDKTSVEGVVTLVPKDVPPALELAQPPSIIDNAPLSRVMSVFF
jgi:hypothetical protein